MERVVRVGSYGADGGLRLEWTYGFEIAVKVESDEAVISANKAGLISLAQHLLTLAADEVPAGTHVHLDAARELEDNSCDLVLARRNGRKQEKARPPCR